MSSNEKYFPKAQTAFLLKIHWEKPFADHLIGGKAMQGDQVVFNHFLIKWSS